MADNTLKITINVSPEEKEALQNAVMQLSLMNKKRLGYHDILLLGIEGAGDLWQRKYQNQ